MSRFSVGDMFCFYDMCDSGEDGEGGEPFLVFYLDGEVQKPRIGKSRTEKHFSYKVMKHTKECLGSTAMVNEKKSLSSRWLSALCREENKPYGWHKTYCKHIPVAS